MLVYRNRFFEFKWDETTAHDATCGAYTSQGPKNKSFALLQWLTVNEFKDLALTQGMRFQQPWK